MKAVKELNGRKAPIITMNESLEEHKDKIICLEKLRKANEMLKTTKLPESKYQSS